MTVAKLSRASGLPTEVAVQRDATRAWLIQALRRGLIIDASCHGSFDPDDFLRSALHLAYGQRLHLASLLSHEVDLRGLRLLMLSACQTAVLDLRGAVNEVRSLAVGMLQAGAQAVLAALWEVDEQATYLLLVRFVQEWFPHMNQMPPALALMRAQQWLRTVKNRDLREWHSGPSDVEELLHMIAGQQDDPDACPYADPVYWAGFQIVGW